MINKVAGEFHRQLLNYSTKQDLFWTFQNISKLQLSIGSAVVNRIYDVVDL
jgi:hypothetical protein